MSLFKVAALCLPTVIVTLISDFVPWGIIAGLVTLAVYAVILFIPGKSIVRLHANTATEALAIGEIGMAKDHVEIALREAIGTEKMAIADLKLLQTACDSTASALAISGQLDAANTLRKRTEDVITGSSQKIGS